MRRGLTRNVVLLGLVSLANDASGEMIAPLLPLFLTSVLGAGAMTIGLIEGLTESLASMMKLPAGWVSDRLGRRKPLVVAGYGLAALTRPVLGMATAGWEVLGLRLADRMGKGLRGAPRDALLADSTAAESRGMTFGFHRAMDHLGAVVGALTSLGLVALWQEDYRRIFMVAAIPALATIPLLLLGVREGEQPAAVARPKAGGFDRNFRIYLGTLLLFTLGNSSDAFLLLRARECGMGAAGITGLWAMLHVSKAAVSVIGGSLSDRFGRKRPILAGWMVYAAIYGGFAAATEIWHFAALFLIYGCYFGLTEGVEKALVADLVRPEQRGTAFGLFNLTIGIGALPASLLAGMIWERQGAGVALGMGAVLAMTAAGLLAIFVEERRMPG